MDHKGTSLFEISNIAPPMAERCTLATSLDTNRNNCTDNDCHGSHSIDKEEERASREVVKWSAFARSKMLSEEVALGLMDHVFKKSREGKPKREHHKWLVRYQKTLECCNYVIQCGNEAHMVRCRQRWCVTCNRSRAGKASIAYREILEGLSDPHFVTLTIRNCKAGGLRPLIGEMQQQWRRIRASIKRKGYDLRGFKKMECTANDKRNDYHPHFHLIVEGREVADLIQREWLRRLAGRVKQSGQSVYTITEGRKQGVINEILKYCFKDAKGGELIDPERLHVMNEAFFGKRTHEVLGFRKVNTEPLPTAKLEAPNNEYPAHKVYTWSSEGAMWYNGSEPFFHWFPSKKITDMVAHSRNRRGVNTS